MNLHVIDTGHFKLDGGAMFGVVPKALWNRHQPADENNRCTWAMRCLLIEAHGRVILIDTGMGNKQDDKFRSHFEPHGEGDLLASIARLIYKGRDYRCCLNPPSLRPLRWRRAKAAERRFGVNLS